MRAKKSIPKRHRFKIGETVKFHFAGSYRNGVITELTKEATGHATYTVKSAGVIYPCLGFKCSKEVGNVIDVID